MKKDLGTQRKLREKVDKLRLQGRLPQAMGILEDEKSNKAVQAETLATLAAMQLYYQNPEMAMKLASQALKANFNPTAILFIQALASRAAGDTEQARKYAELLLNIQPDHRGAKDILLLLEGRTERPETREKIQRLREKKSPLIISIRSPSDREKDPAMQPLWGDFWVKEELSNEFKRMGLEVSDTNPDIILHFSGLKPKSMPETTYNIVWQYSHPDLITPQSLRPFDKIACAAVSFIPKLDAFGYLQPDLMPACTSKTPITEEPVYDLIFLGNARKSRPDGRSVVADMLAAGLDFKVWGNLWETLLPNKHYGGHYWEYERLGELYASARITLNDHNPDMAREGFVSNKVFDILASGGFVISQANKGLKDIFGDTVPEYETPGQLKELACHYLDNPDQREALRLRGQKVALNYTYRKCAEQLISDLWE